METKPGLYSRTSTIESQQRTSREHQEETKLAWQAYENQMVSTSAMAAPESARRIPEMPIRNFLRVVFVR